MNMISAEVRSLLVVKVCEGKGTEDDVKRIVTYIYEQDGLLLAVFDPEQRTLEHPK